MLKCATGTEYPCYLFQIPHLGRENMIDNYPFSLLIMSSVLVHAGCCYKMPEAGLFISHVIYHCTRGYKSKIRVPAWLSE